MQCPTGGKGQYVRQSGGRPAPAHGMNAWDMQSGKGDMQSGNTWKANGGQTTRRSHEARRFNVRYLLVMVGLATFVVFSHLFMAKSMDTQSGDASEINLAGRQRMLSERIALKLYEISSLPPSLTLTTARQELEDAIINLETTHNALINGDKTLNLPGIRSAAIRTLYFGPEGRIDSHLKSVAATAREFLAISTQNQQSPTSQPNHRTLQFEIENLIKDLDRVVFQYQRESDERKARAEMVGRITTIILLALLAASAVWVFRPMSREINSAIVNLLETQQWLEEAKARAEDANRAKSAFLANMSHELRTPLNSIIGYSEVLLEDAQDTDDATYVPHLKKVLYAGQHLSSLINDILDFSKIEAGKIELSVGDIQLPDLIDEVTATIQPMIDNGHNTLTVDVPLAIETPIRNDAMKLRQVLVNLLGNAAKFTEGGDIKLSIDVSQENDSDWLVMSISDTGIGMSPDEIESLFEEFTQADTSAARKYQGTGLGLAITKHFIGMMGGTIDVESVKGEGSTFVVKLPANIDERSARQGRFTRAKAPMNIPNDRTTILVVDDDPNARELMVRHLTKEGFQVTTASSGQEALNRAIGLDPDLITLDVMMDDMSGWDVLKQLKSTPETCNTPVIMCSIIDDRNRGLNLGAVEYLTKPINCNRLIESIDRYVQRSESDEVLIVEDDPDTRALVSRHICDFGLAPREAANGLEALEILDHKRPPVFVVLDLMMPRMDGFEFLQAFRNEPEFAMVPVVIVTAKDLDENERRILRDMSADVVQKSQNNLKQTLKTLTDQIFTTLPATPNNGGGNG